jgi:hypothetical protein
MMSDDCDGWARKLHDAAKQVLDERGVPLLEAFGTKPSKVYEGTELSWE